jgi:hypothetical protein
MLGINLGKVGFLAVAETGDIDTAVRDVVDGTYTVHERLTIDVRAEYDGRILAESWALNEVSVEKGQRAQMLEVHIDIDGRPLSRYGCDGVVCATPTGSTAYAFSAGGPVVWPEVEALLLVPVSAHALFSQAAGDGAHVDGRGHRRPVHVACSDVLRRPAHVGPAAGARVHGGTRPAAGPAGPAGAAAVRRHAGGQVRPSGGGWRGNRR